MFVLSVFLLAAPVAAEEPDAAMIVLPEQGMERVSVTPRRVEIKRALVSGAAQPLSRDDRRQLSQEERHVLSRELREAIHGVYDSRRGDRDR